ncbi:MAG: hypothetical protein HOV80_28895 [Polyangiaceae bacterium]|nr:hypothetical protein [Polyangiaceae bacterium]
MKLIAGLTTLLLATTIMPQRVSAPPVEACIKVFPIVRYRGVAYDHIVRLESACETERECSVVTDVNPTPSIANVPPGEAVEVLTFRGSPSRTFRATIECDARSSH